MLNGCVLMKDERYSYVNIQFKIDVVFTVRLCIWETSIQLVEL